jgi:hypothetical protein
LSIGIVDVIDLSAVFPDVRVEILRVSEPWLHANRAVSQVPLSYINEKLIAVGLHPIIPLSVINDAIILNCLENSIIPESPLLWFSAILNMKCRVNILLSCIVWEIPLEWGKHGLPFKKILSAVKTCDLTSDIGNVAQEFCAVVIYLLAWGSISRVSLHTFIS